MPVSTVIEKSRKALSEGDLQRALQIARSSLGNFDYSPELLSLYGELLLERGDLPAAGRYLFFSKGHTTEREKEAINKFLSKLHKVNYCTLLAKFPKCKIVKRLSELPDYPREELIKMGCPEEISDIITPSPSIADKFAPWLVFGIFIGTLVLAFIGGIEVLKWIF